MTGPCTHASSETLTLYYYDELGANERARFAAHIERCQACARALAELDTVRAGLSDRANVGRTENEWAAFMTRLDRAIDGEAADRSVNAEAKVSPFGAQRRVGAVATQPVRGHLARYPALALAAALVIGVGLGLLWQRQALDRGAAGAPATMAPALTAAERHLNQARLVVLGLAARDPAAAGPADWAYERELAASLLPDTRLFRMAARDRGDATLADLLGDLETVLLQAGLSSDPGTPELQRLQRLIDRRDLIGRMDLRDTIGSRSAGAAGGARPPGDSSVRGL
jgi:hypothetical protein